MKVIAKYVTVEAVKEHGMKPLTSATGSKGLDGDDFTDAYKERSDSND